VAAVTFEDTLFEPGRVAMPGFAQNILLPLQKVKRLPCCVGSVSVIRPWEAMEAGCSGMSLNGGCSPFTAGNHYRQVSRTHVKSSSHPVVVVRASRSPSSIGMRTDDW
jgi:hypothetical protein